MFNSRSLLLEKPASHFSSSGSSGPEEISAFSSIASLECRSFSSSAATMKASSNTAMTMLRSMTLTVNMYATKKLQIKK